ERGIVMGEFGFITADGIYHVTVYATDEEGKFRILAMRSYPYEEHPKTIEMIVRPKAKSTTPKAIAPPTTTTERAKPKPVEKHNFSVQGCSGCFIKNNVPTTTTTTRKPEDKKYGIRPLSQPLAPEEAPQIGKHVISQVLPQVLKEVQQVETKLKETEVRVPTKVGGAVVIDRNRGGSKVSENRSKGVQKIQAATQNTLGGLQKEPGVVQTAQKAGQKANTQTQKVPLLAQNAREIIQKAPEGTERDQKNLKVAQSTQQTQTTLLGSGTKAQIPHVTPLETHLASQTRQGTPQKAQTTVQKTQATTRNREGTPPTSLKDQEAIQRVQERRKQALQNERIQSTILKAQATTQQAQTLPQKTDITQFALQHNTPLATQTNIATTIPLETLSTKTNRLTASSLVSKGSALPPSNTAKTATVGGIGGANAAKAPATTGINALPSAAGAPSAGTTGSTNGISTPKKQLTTPAVTAGNTGGGKGAAAGGGPNTNAGGFGAGSGSGGASGNSGGSKSGSSGAGGFKGGSSGGSTASETGDLYRFKYNLDYNGHRETGAYNGNKEGSFYAIGDDNVERTIEYIANEFGYQPRVRFRKLDAPVQAKENTLKDYEFVWFKKA
ncbi:PREDICTED: protein lethal(3)malignant blood neoplasm 1-like, partial [Rhagoletis zephyria]|uniref:protein lethal(3)malignant blood neoplasm 1-like n=1 Tax=Rhagoletis zephyria TaxID=28612 RepID=UPI0008116DE2